MCLNKKKFNLMDLNNFNNLDQIDDIEDLRKLEKYLNIIMTNNKEFFLSKFKEKSLNNFTKEQYLTYKEAFFRIKIKDLIEKLEILKDKKQRVEDLKYEKD